MFPEGFQIVGTDSRRRPVDLVDKVKHCLVFVVEKLAVVVESQRLDFFLSDSDPLRRSGMRLGSILAPVGH